MNRPEHWNAVYETKAETDVSWFESVPGESLRLLEAAGMNASSCLIDVTADWSLKPMDIWHDRAVFHFLTSPADRSRYVSHLRRTLKPHGSVIMATLALDGPEKCSGLPVVRYSPESLARELGTGFELVESARYLHPTPSGRTQAFQYSRFVKTQ